MNAKLMKAAVKNYPQMNKLVLEGLAFHATEQIESWIDNRFKEAAQSFPPAVKYHGLSRVDPATYFLKSIKVRNNRRITEINFSDHGMLKITVSFNGVMLPCSYFYIPLINKFNLLTHNGGLYQVTPILTASLYNIEGDVFFIAANRSKIKIEQLQVSFLNGFTPVLTTVSFSMLFWGIPNPSDRSPLKPTLLHYILSVMGLTEAFKRLFNIEIKAFLNADNEGLVADEPNVYILRSAGVLNPTKPCSKFRFMVKLPKNVKMNHGHHALFGALFYIIDNSGDFFSTTEELENNLAFLRLLDNFIFKKRDSESKITKRMNDHIKSISETFDSSLKAAAAVNGIRVDSIFDFFADFILNAQDLLRKCDEGSMYDKELQVLPFILRNINKTITNVMHALGRQYNSGKLTYETTEKIFKAFMVDTWSKELPKHGETQPYNETTACSIHSSACLQKPHTKATALYASKVAFANNRSVLLHASQFMVSDPQYITDKDCFGRNVTNPFLHVNKYGKITKNPALMPELEELAAQLKLKPKQSPHFVLDLPENDE